MPATRYNFEIFKGLTFEGLQLIALDATGAAIPQGAGTTYLLQARTVRGGTLTFELPANRGTEEEGQILVPEVDAATTATFPVGLFPYDLIPIGSDGKAYRPIMFGNITVSQAISQTE